MGPNGQIDMTAAAIVVVGFACCIGVPLMGWLLTFGWSP